MGDYDKSGRISKFRGGNGVRLEGKGEERSAKSGISFFGFGSRELLDKNQGRCGWKGGTLNTTFSLGSNSEYKEKFDWVCGSWGKEEVDGASVPFYESLFKVEGRVKSKSGRGGFQSH